MKLFSMLALLLSSIAFTPVSVSANENGNCKAGCDHTRAPGRGTGKSMCVVVFVAPKGADALKVQLFDSNGQGILRNKKGEIALRGGEQGTTRVAVDCRDYRRAYELVDCVIDADGRYEQRRIRGEGLHRLVPPGHRKGQIDVQI